MKFDVVLGNPPYSLAGNKKGKKGRTINLYPEFYQQAVELGDNVAMIVPDSHRQDTPFNKFIRDNTNKIIPISETAFEARVKTWCLVKDGSDTNVDHIDWADLHQLPEQKVLWAKGKINVTTESKYLEDKGKGPYTVFHKINMKGLHQSKTNLDIPPARLFPSEGYAVLLPQQMQDKGWTASEIVKCDGTQAAAAGVTIVFVSSQEEGKYLIDYMKQESFVKQALSYCIGMRNMTLGALQRINMDDYSFR